MSGNKVKVIYEVIKIVGECPVYKEGDEIVIDCYRTKDGRKDLLNLKETDALCMRALGSQINCKYLWWATGTDAALEHESQTFKCSSVAEPYGKGYVIFKARRKILPQEESLKG